MMSIIGNILWLFFGGLFLGVMWLLAGVMCCVTLIGIPLGIQCFKFARFALWPFGSEVVPSGRTLPFCLNVLWVLCLGWELAVVSACLGLFWCVTIVGIPFGVQCFKFIRLALMPFGSEVR